MKRRRAHQPAARSTDKPAAQPCHENGKKTLARHVREPTVCPLSFFASPSSSPVRTLPFHGKNRGSNPRGDAIFNEGHHNVWRMQRLVALSATNFRILSAPRSSAFSEARLPKRRASSLMGPPTPRLSGSQLDDRNFKATGSYCKTNHWLLIVRFLTRRDGQGPQRRK